MEVVLNALKGSPQVILVQVLFLKLGPLVGQLFNRLLVVKKKVEHFLPNSLCACSSRISIGFSQTAGAFHPFFFQCDKIPPMI